MITLTDVDLFTLSGYFIGSFGVGFTFGFLLKSFVKGAEKVG